MLAVHTRDLNARMRIRYGMLDVLLFMTSFDIHVYCLTFILMNSARTVVNFHEYLLLHFLLLRHMIFGAKLFLAIRFECLRSAMFSVRKIRTG